MATKKLLFDAACDGKLEVLENYLEENPLGLTDLRLIYATESLLHVATKARQVNFVSKLIQLDPEIAGELNKDGFRPLDIAAMTGNLEIVKQLLGANPWLCRLKGKEQRTALHYAAMKGRVDVIAELLSNCPDSIQDATGLGETALHLSVKHYQFDAFNMLIERLKSTSSVQPVLNLADCDGNTIMHMAVLTKQLAVIESLLKEDNAIEQVINARNAKGLTPLDILDIVTEDSSYDVRMREAMQAGRAVRARDTGFTINMENPTETKRNIPEWLKYFKFLEGRDSPGDVRNSLLVVAILIATVTFQACVNPPPFLENSWTKGLFWIPNSLAFTASLTIISYLSGGFPFQKEIYLSIYSMTFTYGVALDKAVQHEGNLVKALLYISMFLPFAMRWLPYYVNICWKYLVVWLQD